ncbi:MAG: hypothetical protein KKD05_10640 [Candidatus Omnitrophica bacterium]|nr:hypothetical protein [Candidatus Omnitrophota bacterium]
MKKIINSLKQRFKIINELLEFLWENKIWWLTPFFIVLLLIGGLIIFTASNPAAVPFIYTLF